MESEDLFDETPDLTNTQLDGLLAVSNGVVTTNGHHHHHAAVADGNGAAAAATDDDETQMDEVEALVEEEVIEEATDAAEPADEEAVDDEAEDETDEMVADDDADGDGEESAGVDNATNGDTDETINTAGDQSTSTTNNTAKVASETRMSQLPLSRIKALMKLNPDFGYASAEATFLMCKATELFVESLTRESFVYTAEARKKTVQRKDVEKAIESVDALMFLEGAMT